MKRSSSHGACFVAVAVLCVATLATAGESRHAADSFAWQGFESDESRVPTTVAWAQWFDTAGQPIDRFDANGFNVPNGVPDAVDRGAHDVGVLETRSDDGTSIRTLLHSATTPDGRTVLHFGFELVGSAEAVLELNQRLERSPGDVLLRTRVDASGEIENVQLSEWKSDATNGESFSGVSAELSGAGCTTQATMCAERVTNPLTGSRAQRHGDRTFVQVTLVEDSRTADLTFTRASLGDSTAKSGVEIDQRIFLSIPGPLLVTDRTGYLPGDTVVVTGHGFYPSTIYDLPVQRPDGTIVKGDGLFNADRSYSCPDRSNTCWDTVKTAADGSFAYTYVLDTVLGAYRVGAYEHRAADLEDHTLDSWTFESSPLAGVGFTNDPLPQNVRFEQWANDRAGMPTADWVTGALSANHDYGECTVVPFRISAGSLRKQTPGMNPTDITYEIRICREITGNMGFPGYDVLDDFDASGITPSPTVAAGTLQTMFPFSGINVNWQSVNVTNVQGGCQQANEAEAIATFTVDTDGDDVFLYFGGHLAVGLHNNTGTIMMSLGLRNSNKTLPFVVRSVDTCGNGVVDPGQDETCDPPGGLSGQPDECRDDCTFCGDGTLDEGEGCDDGNNTSNDGCDADCGRESECGDGILDPFETCEFDPMPTVSNCRGPGNDPTDCTFCGDGDLNLPVEECDDGNNLDGDGCSAECIDEQPMFVALSTFDVDVHSRGVRVTWTTSVELDNAGFRILRGRGDKSPQVVTPHVIPAQGNNLTGAAYEFVDEFSLERGAVYHYWLEDIDTKGTTTLHGPVTIQPTRQRVRRTR